MDILKERRMDKKLTEKEKLELKTSDNNCDHMIGLNNEIHEGIDPYHISNRDQYKTPIGSMYESFNYCPLCGIKLDD